MKTRSLIDLGIPRGPAIEMAKQAARAYAKAKLTNRVSIKDMLADVAAQPEQFADHDIFKQLAAHLIRIKQAKANYQERPVPASYAQWGTGLEEQSLQQMENACRLPISPTWPGWTWTVTSGKSIGRP